ncbi:DUF4336 domain-containing protein [Prochlorococcus sp. MIT 1223]|uniref:DUF4336 domain-containing protein n=1 Tax=Prochlorococcus sp. MIT 1223 TaxID=3096217 RepID=UPI002A75EFD7|nr:DUF4336 domain-containing protein [Prochlorococcus sp. MIT 1223]
MINNINKSEIDTRYQDQEWPWWPLFPLYPYGRKRTIFSELIPNQIWSFEQLQGIYYVAVPIRLSVIKVSGGLMLFNPLPPTIELLNQLSELERKHGPVIDIVLPTASGLEHKISLPSLSRAFPKANLWICPGQWSFPIDLPLTWIGIPQNKTRVLFEDGLPHSDKCEWFSLGPLDIGLGRFQEVSCYHRSSNSLLVTDALVGISASPPKLFELDPTPLLFHSRESGEEPLVDSYEARIKGWRRLVLFSSFLKPAKLSIPSLLDVFSKSFKPGLRNPSAHFGIYPFNWEKGWEESASNLVGERDSLVQIAPVIERLVFPRAKDTFVSWLDKVGSCRGLKWLISSHYNAPVKFSRNQAIQLKKKINRRIWAQGEGNWTFLDWLDKKLLNFGVVPENPLKSFND